MSEKTMTNEELRQAIETLGTVPRSQLYVAKATHVQEQLLALIDEQVRRATLAKADKE